ncbi:hypothetical protein [Paenibacillus contaminans]|nr:hypothetical protein [Paenibacillus contaminans]
MSLFTKVGKEVADSFFQDDVRNEVDAAFYYANIYFQETQGDMSEFEAFVRRITDPLDPSSNRLLDRKARRYAARYRKLRIYEDDFRSEFNTVIAVFMARLSRGEFTGDNIMKQLSKAFHYRAVDLVRKAKSKTYSINHLVARLDDAVIKVNGQPALLIDAMAASDNTEKQVIDRTTIEEMASEPSLTEQERKLFEYLRTDPEATLQEMADTVGLRDRKQAQRVRQRLADKLRKYIEYGEEAAL